MFNLFSFFKNRKQRFTNARAAAEWAISRYAELSGKFPDLIDEFHARHPQQRIIGTHTATFPRRLEELEAYASDLTQRVFQIEQELVEGNEWRLKEIMGSYSSYDNPPSFDERLDSIDAVVRFQLRATTEPAFSDFKLIIDPMEFRLLIGQNATEYAFRYTQNNIQTCQRIFSQRAEEWEKVQTIIHSQHDNLQTPAEPATIC